MHENAKYICRKACVCHLLIVKKTQYFTYLDGWREND